MLVAQNSLGPVCPVPLTVRGTGAAGEALRLDDEAALLKAWTARATRRGAGKEARALARYLACLPLDDARGPCAAINMARHPRAVAAPPPAGIRAGAVATRSRRSYEMCIDVRWARGTTSTRASTT